MSESLIYPKVTERVSSVPDQIADDANFMALATGVIKGMHAAKNNGKGSCIGQKPLIECDAAKQAVRATLELIPNDSNEDFSGWVGYEKTNTDCGDCKSGCSAQVFWQEGTVTELIKILFSEKLEPDIEINIGTSSYRP